MNDPVFRGDPPWTICPECGCLDGHLDGCLLAPPSPRCPVCGEPDDRHEGACPGEPR